MTITLGHLLMAEQAFQRLGAIRMAAKPAYQVKKLLSLAGDHLGKLRKIQNEWIAELGVETKRGQYAIPPETPAFDTYRERMEAMLADEVTLAWTPIAFDALGDEKISPADLIALDPFLVAPVDGPQPHTGG
jgi:hypothetical protein